MNEGLILGGGVTGLAVGMASGWPVLEAADGPGGLCGSYYMTPAGHRLPEAPADDEAFRFEVGGGHWIFDADDSVLSLLKSVGPLASHRRKATAYFASRNLHVPYPIQRHAELLGADPVTSTPTPAANAGAHAPTLRQWLHSTFGPTLCEQFFFPFHELYTAGLYDRIAPQDGYKSPTAGSGYNGEFLYPVSGLDALTRAMAARCRIHYRSRVIAIDVRNRSVLLEDGRELNYTRLISTLPLNRMLELTQIEVEAPTDPWTSVLVLNIAARRGHACPDAHWVYLPATEAGFHRVGFYDHVEPSFLPRSRRAARELTSLYVERAFAAGTRPTARECDAYAADVVRELQSWGFIGDALIVDPTWIDVAYTWSWPGSAWKQQAIAALAAESITQVGRYGRWVFQGIGASIRDGLTVGTSNW